LSAGPRKAKARLASLLVLFLATAVALPPFAWPIRGRVTSGMFLRHKPDSAFPLAIEIHRGLDIAAAAGTPVHATAPGIVVEEGSSPELGNFVRVRHLLGFTSLYGHLSRIDVKRGRLILFRGLSSIGAVGSTGRSTGPHLHFALEGFGLLLPPRVFLSLHSLRRAIVGF
jgi:murein DD-endopeptidase MepM/ murein hydrolase activator NlpD